MRERNDPRRLAGDALADALRDSRARTLTLVNELDDAQWRVPQQPGVNPLAWELAHIAWFAEFWILRGPHERDAAGFAHAAQPARIAGPDGWFDSARLPHAQRWRIALPTRAQVLNTLEAQLDACLKVLPEGDDDAALYFHRLALFHEDMHAEAFEWTRAALGYAAPAARQLHAVRRSGLVKIAGGEVRIGRDAAQRGFAFDNELQAHTVALDDFEIDASPVTAGQFLSFVEAGGYAHDSLWPGAAGHWLAQARREAPERWRRTSHGGWEVRWFDRHETLQPDAPAVHINAFEAQAYCLWARRRLPSAAQWEHAAPHIEWGHDVWEWTRDAFEPYPGFAPGPYAEYSAPWFGTHRELRGASIATSARLRDARYRNFFTPERSDVFAGFRTVAAAL
ncbi:MAG TPA: selenoneine synthase SenA [Burkholderiaceae bacterium]|nr:selenoneine synthase SenA [Burkholderiaceae bacterium]